MTPADLLTPLEAVRGEPIPDPARVCVTRLCLYQPSSVREWADTCGVGQKTLNGWLSEAGLPGARSMMALHSLLIAHVALTNGESIAEAAFLAEYSDAPTLSAACVRHIGIRPGALRRVPEREVVERWHYRKQVAA